MRKPTIGLIPLWDDDRDSIWMLTGYVQGILKAGGIPITLPLTTDTETLKQSCEMCDGFLLTGGHDVDPSLYGAETSSYCGTVCRVRDTMEKYILDYALVNDIAVLGICRGIQFINVALGGTLYQHLPVEHPSDIEHHQNPPYDIPIHSVRILTPSPLFTLLGTQQLQVNSYHHQAIKDISPDLTVMAVSEDDLIEAVYVPGKHFIWAVQWHPEFSFHCDPASITILQSFVNAASKQ